MSEFSLKIWMKKKIKAIIESIYYEDQPIVDIESSTFDYFLSANYKVIEVRTEVGCHTGDILCIAILSRRYWKWRWQRLAFNAAA